MFVYFDITNFCFVVTPPGKFFAVCLIKETPNQIVDICFNLTHYVPFLPHSNTIHVILPTDFGENTEVETGVFLVKLHFCPIELY